MLFDGPGATTQLLFAVILVPALLLAARVFVRGIWPASAAPSRRPTHDRIVGTALTLAVAAGLIPACALLLHAVFRAPIDLWWSLAAAALVGFAGVEAQLRQRRRAGLPRPRPADLLRAPSPHASAARALPVLAASLGVGLLFLLRHASAVPPSSCIGEAAIALIGHGAPGVDALTDNIGDARLGNSAVISVFLVAFGHLGFRVLFALCGVLLALSGYALGGWLGLVALALNPYVLSLPLLDENLLTLAFSGPVVLLLVSAARDRDRAPPWWTIGALHGLLVSMRVPMIATLPATFLILLVRPGGGRPWALARASLGLLTTTLVIHLHHLWALGSLARFEHNAQYPPAPYEVFGVAFQWQGLMGWPLHDTLVRTPHNPFPMSVGWPLWLLDHLGLGLAALALLGVVALCRRSLLLGLALSLLWWLPVQAGLSLQEAWDYPNKMGVMLIAMAPLPLWLGTAAGDLTRAASARAGRRLGLWVTAWAVLVGLLSWGVGRLGEVQAAVDLRYFDRFELPAVELKAQREARRRAMTDVGLLPDFARAARYAPLLDLGNIAAFLRHEQPLAWGWRRDELPARGAPVDVVLDLRAPVWERDAWIRVPEPGDPEDVALDLTTLRGAAITAVEVGWHDRPLYLHAALGPRLAVFELALMDYRQREPGCDPTTAHCHCRFYEVLDRGITPVSCAGYARFDVPGGGDRLRVRLPAGGVSALVGLNPVGNVYKLWTAVAKADDVTPRPSRLFWHN